MTELEINLVVADPERSRAFYTALGCSLRPISRDPDDVQAWMAVDGPLPVTVHSVEFARWWDTTGPSVSPGSTVVDVTVDRTTAHRILDAVPAYGGEVVQPLRNMPWRQAYAILTDPDGYRWGVKTDLAEQEGSA
ncbi:Glyoxalase-like domain protein [Streptomyces sp. YIM 130001]|uniref:VOC family protein n=1 Tax=Streptomyces sp. YIM 130001 TaxID=2259644 RepID=UPI000E65B4D8|nr:VOC family protein [Streptomyces sp. YIM 130001]RII19629.1 Glyoxalase-like domain protein [Streptomyces sp. YIM 130001]